MSAGVAEEVRPSSRLMQVMLATELDRLAATPDAATGHRLRVIMRMVDRAASRHPLAPPE